MTSAASSSEPDGASHPSAPRQQRDVISIALTRDLMQLVKQAALRALEQGTTIQYRQIGETALQHFLAAPNIVTTRRLVGPTTRIEISRALLREVKAYAVMQQADGGPPTNQCGVLDHAIRRYLAQPDENIHVEEDPTSLDRDTTNIQNGVQASGNAIRSEP